MLWGCFSRDCVGSLVPVRGIMDRFGHQKILSQHMLPHARSKMTPDWLFQYDNASKDKSKYGARFLNREKVNVIRRPGQSTELNPIQHRLQELERRVRTRNFTIEDVLFEALQREWLNIPEQRLQKLVDTMPDRCLAVMRATGYATKYWRKS